MIMVSQKMDEVGKEYREERESSYGIKSVQDPSKLLDRGKLF